MGGTIEFFDPAYDALNKKLMKLDASIETYFNNIIKPHFTFSTEEITQKDSRDIAPQDRDALLQAIKNSSHENILVTHGTFTMKETAQFLERVDLGNKKVIVTGSMIPVAGFSVSDAGFNLGFSVAMFASIKPDVYISINGGIFKPDDVNKNTDQFRFE
jgi:L-asparaginase